MARDLALVGGSFKNAQLLSLRSRLIVILEQETIVGDRNDGGISVLGTLGDEGQDSCLSSAGLLSPLGDRWTVLVLGALTSGPVRFNVILRTVNGITHRMLTLTLRKLQRDGLVERAVQDTTPISVTYTLTPVGESLIGHLRALVRWAHDQKATIASARQTYDHSRNPGVE